MVTINILYNSNNDYNNRKRIKLFDGATAAVNTEFTLSQSFYNFNYIDIITGGSAASSAVTGKFQTFQTSHIKQQLNAGNATYYIDTYLQPNLATNQTNSFYMIIASLQFLSETKVKFVYNYRRYVVFPNGAGNVTSGAENITQRILFRIYGYNEY